MELKNSMFVILSFFCVNCVNCQDEEDCNNMKDNCKVLVEHGTANYPDYADLRTPDLIKMFGYPVEEHDITTEDGYILTVYRIPYSDRSPKSVGKIPVFCMHGLLTSSGIWFWQPAERALVFMLVDAGYDVWIGNARGTSYSQRHLFLSANDPINLSYWDFSVYEMGNYDVPAYINYITETTGQPSIYYIGHSLGGCQFFIAITLHPELNSKIRAMFALAPAVYTGKTSNPFVNAAALLLNRQSVEVILNTMVRGKMLPSVTASVLGALANFCSNALRQCGLCFTGVLITGEFNVCQANFTTLPGVLAHIADQTSVKTFFHSSQAILTGKFRLYDYGYFRNLQHYGTSAPPEYDWSNFHVPVVMYSGQSDSLVAPLDLQILAGKLGQNVKEYISVQYKGWTHFDFIIAKDADKLVYNHIIDVMNNQTYG